jgi:hypothetical protein
MHNRFAALTPLSRGNKLIGIRGKQRVRSLRILLLPSFHVLPHDIANGCLIVRIPIRALCCGSSAPREDYGADQNQKQRPLKQIRPLHSTASVLEQA